MTNEAFCYWLQGYSEITNGQLPSTTQWQVITDHLKMTLKEPTPSRSLINASPTGFLYTGNVSPLSGDSVFSMSWYPESLRQHNLAHPENPLMC